MKKLWKRIWDSKSNRPWWNLWMPVEYEDDDYSI